MNTALWYQLIRNPRTTGALFPSSRHLAEAIASACVDADCIVELGAGGGAITEVLWRRWPQRFLCSIELRETLAATLRRRFPELTVIQGCAAAQLRQVQPPPAATVALVSSLPFRSLPRPVARMAQDAVCDFLAAHPGSRLVQYTYRASPPFAVDARFRWQKLQTVWKNIPPAGVWMLAHQASAQATTPLTSVLP